MDILAIVFGLIGLVVVGSTLTGNSQELCDKIGGTYTPHNAQLGMDVCPGAEWKKLFEKTPEPK